MYEQYKFRRKQLVSSLQDGDIVIISAAQQQHRNGDCTYPFRQDSNFYYLTNWDEPNAYLIVKNDNGTATSIMFCQERDPVTTCWSGAVRGVSEAKEIFDYAYNSDDFFSKIILWIKQAKTIYSLSSMQQSFSERLCEIMQANNIAASSMRDITSAIAELRLVKDETEISLMRTAAQISCAAHSAIMQSCKPGLREIDVEAIFLQYCYKNNCRDLAYASIVAGGNNACILHYTKNSSILSNGELLLVDAGVEYKNYAADITRTIPINGKYSPAQAALYNIVLQAQLAVIAAVKPGATWSLLNQIAINEITIGLVSLGILVGDIADLIASHACKRFYMHGVGHWLGLDVHDIAPSRDKDATIIFAAGMLLTVEPGIYITSDQDVASKWHNIGIRIEDDILVTADGCEVLTSSLPKTIVAIEQMVGQV